MPWLQHGQNYTTTMRFVRLSDKFFNCLSVSNVCDGQRKRTPDFDPYRNKDDYRLKVTALTIFEIQFPLQKHNTKILKTAI